MSHDTTEQHICLIADRQGNLRVEGIEVRPGEVVELVVTKAGSEAKRTFPLRGKPFRYERPTDPVADTDWEAR